MIPVKTYNLVLLFIVHLFICTAGKAQLLKTNSNNYYVEHFGEEEGLPQNSINGILPDSNDFLWIATEGGISRFNGNRFITVPFKSNIANSNFTRIKNFYYKGRDTIVAFSAAAHQLAYIVNNTIVGFEK